MVIADVEADTLFTPFLPLARLAGFRAVQSTPIMGREGVLLGTLATHFRSMHKLTEQNFRLLDLYVGQAADIIERHKAEDALHESEERLRLAQLKTGIGVWERNLRTGTLTWTPELAALFGLEAGTVKSYADFRERVHPGDIAALQAKRDAAVRDRKSFYQEFRIVRSDGQIRWISVMAGAVYDEATGEPGRIVGNLTDNHRPQARRGAPTSIGRRARPSRQKRARDRQRRRFPNPTSEQIGGQFYRGTRRPLSRPRGLPGWCRGPPGDRDRAEARE
jgi:PAS domain S-box-containing protein